MTSKNHFFGACSWPILCVFFAVIACTPKLKREIDDGLIIYYPFNSEAKDVSGNEFHGIISGAYPTEDRFGNRQSAYQFDGRNDYIVFPNRSVMHSLPLSISFWVYFDSLNPAILGTCISENQSGIWFSIGTKNATKNKLAINYGDGGPPSPLSRKSFVGNETFATGKWYHVLATVGRHGEMTLYVNGRETDGNMSGNANTFYAGEDPGYIGRVWQENSFFQGKIDEFRVYNRILTQSEISYLAH
jgi:hypothetical protein